MAGHFPCQYRAFLLHFGLDDGMSRFPHNAPTSPPVNIIVQELGSFHFRNKRTPGVCHQDIPGKEQEKTITP